MGHGYAMVVLVGCLHGLTAGWAAAQALPESAPRPRDEARLREHLRKLDRWGLIDLLRTEREVDERQKQRAAVSARPEELTALSVDEDSGVRFLVAVNPHTPAAVQAQLAQDSLAYVRGGVAMALSWSASASASVRASVERTGLLLSADAHPVVRLALAGNTRLPPAVLGALVADGDDVVRERLAANVQLEREALRALAADSVLAVRVTALQHRNMPSDVLGAQAADPDPRIRAAVCRNPNASSAVLAALSRDPETEVRLAVARHRGTPAAVLPALAEDTDVQVVVAAAQHAGASRDLLLRLAADARSLEIREAAQRQLEPILRSEIREDVLERWEAP